MNIASLPVQMHERGASDLHIKVDNHPVMRINGRLRAIGSPKNCIRLIECPRKLVLYYERSVHAVGDVVGDCTDVEEVSRCIGGKCHGAARARLWTIQIR